ncbi:Fur family transcriptional regulator [Ornithinicoccus hortensis]|uniref:Fur family ferric uptake transcriptional regulator n=1 Tax=Ornithinicoccus hortensis TaxID=82346 RepID=A0A542YNN5_9MICO|nr:Fur family transcriptional regulator [Ornithinicoccus hortensis]TQL49649.1 Fur family ferric uptake transcriptional regulator [Ornithinicoccus hortensis]
MSPTSHEVLLRDAGLRVTAPRLAVLAEVQTHPHATAESVRVAVHERLGTVSTQAVYGVLNTLTSAGILRRFEPEGSASRYELFRGDNHHHAVCRSCGQVTDVACATGTAPCLHAPEGHGFEIEMAEVIYWGTCPSCLSHPVDDSTAPHQKEKA